MEKPRYRAYLCCGPNCGPKGASALLDFLSEEVERLGAQYLAMGSLSASDCDTFRTAIKKLQSMYADHIRVEDTVIFPLAARVLSQEEKTVIAGEMAGRRNVALTPVGAQKERG